MKTTLASIVSLPVLSAMPLAAAIYTSDFSGLGLEESLEGVDGWQLSEPNYIEGNIEYFRAFGGSLGGSPAAAVGGLYDPLLTNVNVDFFHAYRAMTVDLSRNFNFSMTFAIRDSETAYYPNRSQFTIGFHSGNVEFFSLVFKPVLNEEISEEYPQGDGLWTIFTSTGGVLSSQDIGLAAQTEQPYLFNFSTSSDDGTYNYSVGSTLLAYSGGGLLEDLAAESITELRVGMQLANGSQEVFGSNYIMFNGITAIPEPSGLILVSIGALAGIFRRRR